MNVSEEQNNPEILEAADVSEKSSETTANEERDWTHSRVQSLL